MKITAKKINNLMSLYDSDNLPNFPRMPKIKFPKPWRAKKLWAFFLLASISSFFGFFAGILSGSVFYLEARDYLADFKIDVPEKIIEKSVEYIPQTTQEEKIIDVVNKFSPAVVSIVITKDLPVFEQYYVNPFFLQQRQIGTEKKEIGGGSGFIISEDGMVLTNKHVVLDEEADYTVLTNDGKKFSAEVLARDPVQDLAVLKIKEESYIDGSGDITTKSFLVVKLGDSDKLQMGQTVVAIGNALGEFRNTISVGVISGLGRTITASGGGSFVETIEDVIQTDAAINRGNSGGPLLNLMGEVIGINTATVIDAQNIGFAIPINKAKRDIEQVRSAGKIIYPFLGERYVLITEKIQKENSLPVSAGAWISADEGEKAVTAGSAAEKAGLIENDIILEFNGEKITLDNFLSKIIQKYNLGDSVTLKILRGEEEKTLTAVLGERAE